MVVLSAIGAFFARIWKWIKETAWVQPLLIVGIIFGVIFSIRPIVDGITNLNNDRKSSDTFYHNYQESLVDGSESKADVITNDIYSVMENPTDSEIDRVSKKYGSKFFLAFVAESCASCKEAKGGFETLRDSFNNYIKESKRADGFKLYTIFTDEVTSDTTTKETAFVQYMDRNSYFFELSAATGYQSDYYMNNGISNTDLEYLEACDPDNFLTPTIMLVDLTNDTVDPGVTELMFGVSGSDDAKKAELLADCWQHEGSFNIK